MAEPLKITLLDWQRTTLENKSSKKAIIAGRRTGKTTLAIVTALTKALECQSIDTPVLYVTPNYAMGRIVFDQLVVIGGKVITHVDSQCHSVSLNNGAIIHIRSIDKCSDIENPYFTIFEECSYYHNFQMTDNMLLIGTPVSKEDVLIKCYENPDWFSMKVTILDNPFFDITSLDELRLQLGKKVFEQEFLIDCDTKEPK